MIPLILAVVAVKLTEVRERLTDRRRVNREVDERMGIPLPKERVELNEPVREEFGCPMPCTARHCIHHAGIVGTVAQRRHSRAAEQLAAIAAWTIPTAEWDVSLLGLKAPSIEAFWALPKRTPGHALADLEARWYASLQGDLIATGKVMPLRGCAPRYGDVTTAWWDEVA